MPQMGRGQFDVLRVNAGGGHYFLLPVLTTTQRNALSAEKGMTIFNSTTGYVENYDGSNWVATGKAYGDATFLKLAGGTMSGAIAMGGNKITGLGAPTAANDAARKTYVDTAIDTDIATHAADLDAHTKNIYEIIRTGEYWAGGAILAGTQALTANTLYASPIVITRAMTIDRLAINISSGGAGGSKARVGIYNNGTNLYPGTLVIDGGEIAADSTGVVAATISQALTKGVYWFAVVSNSTPTIRKSEDYHQPLQILGLSGAHFGSPQSAWYVAHTYAALPDPFTAGGTIYGINIMCVPRIASLD